MKAGSSKSGRYRISQLIKDRTKAKEEENSRVACCERSTDNPFGRMVSTDLYDSD